MKPEKLLLKLTSGNFKNIKFSDIQKLVEDFGFKLIRVSGSHHIYSHDGIKDIINVQNVAGEAKPYQIKQILKIIEIYDLKRE